MANRCERLINVVKCTSRRRSNRLEPKGQRSGNKVVEDLSWTTNSPGEQSEPNLSVLNIQNVVNPKRRSKVEQSRP